MQNHLIQQIPRLCEAPVKAAHRYLVFLLPFQEASGGVQTDDIQVLHSEEEAHVQGFWADSVALYCTLNGG